MQTASSYGKGTFFTPRAPSYVADNSNCRSFLAEVAVTSGNAPMAIPTVTVSDADVKTGSDHRTMPIPSSTKPSPTDATPLPPGAMPAAVVPAIPDWYKVGWREVGGVDVSEAQTVEAKEATIIEKFLSEQYYGAWYHNAGILFFVSATSSSRALSPLKPICT